MSKVFIRPLEAEDALTSYNWRNDPDVWIFTGSRPDREITVDMEKEWIKNVLSDSTSKRFAIEVDGIYVGNVQLTNVNERDAQYHIFIGEKSFWGRGIATKVTYQILCFAKEILQLESVYLDVNLQNTGAIKSYSKNGFTKVGVDGEYLRMVVELENLVKPIVSVFVLVYNHAKYLDECLNGILNQDVNFDFEICVGEDCSPDESRAILLKYQSRYPGKFKLLLHEVNVGAVQNQNMLFDMCQGKYIAICEGDDYWTDPLKLQKQVDILEAHTEYGLIYTDVDFLMDETKVLQPSIFNTYFRPKTTYEELIHLGYIAPCTWLMRKKMLDDILKEYELTSTDGTFVLMLHFAIRSKIYFLNQRTAVYRQLAESASHTQNLKKRYVRELSLWKTQREFIDKISPLGVHQEIDTHFVSNNLVYILMFNDWKTMAEVRKLDLWLSRKYRLLISLCRNEFLFNVVAKISKRILKLNSIN